GAPLQEAVRLLSDQTGMNIVCSSEAGKTKVSLFLQNVTAQVAIEEMCKAHNLSYRVDPSSGVFRITTIEEFQRNLTSFREQETQVVTRLYPNAVSVAQAIHDLFGDRVKLSLGTQNFDDDWQDLQSRFTRFDLVDQRSQGFGTLNNGNTSSNSSFSGNSGYTS